MTPSGLLAGHGYRRGQTPGVLSRPARCPGSSGPPIRPATRVTRCRPTRSTRQVGRADVIRSSSDARPRTAACQRDRSPVRLCQHRCCPAILAATDKSRWRELPNMISSQDGTEARLPRADLRPCRAACSLAASPAGTSGAGASAARASAAGGAEGTGASRPAVGGAAVSPRGSAIRGSWAIRGS